MQYAGMDGFPKLTHPLGLTGNHLKALIMHNLYKLAVLFPQFFFHAVEVRSNKMVFFQYSISKLQGKLISLHHRQS